MTEGELAEFLAMTPPRRVPHGIRRAARRLTAPLFLAIFGALFLAAGVLALTVFFPWAILEDRQLQAADTATATGRVTAVADTRLSIDRRRVVRYEFDFSSAGGERVSGTCYTSGRRWPENAEVSVRYRPEKPALCCIEGARRSVGDGGSALVLLFPLIGAALVAWFVVARLRMNRLLEQGTLAEALVSAIEETGARVNRRPVLEITLQRAGGGVLAVESSWPDVIAFARGRMEAGQPVRVLYDPEKPERALLPGAL